MFRFNFFKTITNVQIIKENISYNSLNWTKNDMNFTMENVS